MKINNYLIGILFVSLVLEILLGRVFSTLNYEFDFILATIFSFYIINRNFLLEEELYQKEKYILNINNLIILIFLYLESVFSSSLIVVNVIFAFSIILLVVNKKFPEKLNIKYISILIVYFVIFFIIKDYFLIVYFSNYEFYVTIYFIYLLFTNVLINVVLVIIFSILFRKKFIIKTKK